MVNLEKGGKVNLSKESEGLKNVIVGLGWDPRSGNGGAFDLDASAFLLTSEKKVQNDKDFVYFRNLKSSDGSVIHTGDNLTGEGEGDDEQIKINLAKVPADCSQIAIAVNIHEAAKRNQNFGQVDNSYIRIVNEDTNEELAKFDLNFDASTSDGVQFGSLIRRNDEWYFSADGNEFNGGLKILCEQYGVNL